MELPNILDPLPRFHEIRPCQTSHRMWGKPCLKAFYRAIRNPYGTIVRLEPVYTYFNEKDGIRIYRYISSRGAEIYPAGEELMDTDPASVLAYLMGEKNGIVQEIST